MTRPGTHEPSASERWSVDSDGLRSNGNASMTSGAPAVVAVGDSFTFGDEVPDRATWPAQLERRLGVPIRNGGVFAYGVDQAYLRALDLLDRFAPQVLVFAFIGDDINRNEFSYYSGSKPNFAYERADLTLHNVPVPKGHVPQPRFARLREVLGYSHLCSAILSRTMPRWWAFGSLERVHYDGGRVTVDLLEKLYQRISGAGGRFVAVTLATHGRIGNNRRIPAVVAEATSARCRRPRPGTGDRSTRARWPNVPVHAARPLRPRVECPGGGGHCAAPANRTLGLSRLAYGRRGGRDPGGCQDTHRRMAIYANQHFNG